jgi:hypothetical protein
VKSTKLVITSWYVNCHRVVERLGLDFLGSRVSSFLAQYNGNGNQPGMLVSILGPKLGEWVKQSDVRSFEELHIQGKLQSGSVFCLESKMRSHGLSVRDAEKSDGMVILSRDLKEFGDHRHLRVKFHQNGLTTDSARGFLMGQPRVFMVAHVHSIDEKEIVCSPLVIGDLSIEDSNSMFSQRYTDGLKVRPSDFDAFKDVNFMSKVSATELSLLKNVSEHEVKMTFADMIGELHVPKDWGGEYCDLYSSQAVLNGELVTCAFALKGPAKFSPMDMTHCGKRGDQIVRLFDTGADVMVLQHCHVVNPAVRKTMEAFSLGRNKRFCIIDGYETVKILRHAGKL